MKKNTFAVEADSEGHKYVAMKITEVTKNHQGGHKQKDIDYAKQQMYGPGVEIFEFYVSKLHPDIDRLFQSPLSCFSPEGCWFKKEPMGKNTLASMMQRISKKAGLSQIYTCHSVRASTITTLFHAGVSPQSIIAITKHRNTNSLKHYIEDLSTPQKRMCSGILSDAIRGSSNSTPNLPGNEHEMNVEDITMGDDGIIEIPPKANTIYNVEIPAVATQDPKPFNIMPNAVFHHCTINFQVQKPS